MLTGNRPGKVSRRAKRQVSMTSIRTPVSDRFFLDSKIFGKRVCDPRNFFAHAEARQRAKDRGQGVGRAVRTQSRKSGLILSKFHRH